MMRLSYRSRWFCLFIYPVWSITWIFIMVSEAEVKYILKTQHTTRCMPIFSLQKIFCSPIQAGPSQKQMKLNTMRPGDDISIRELIESFSKPDNLEHFPLIILLQVFSMVGDIDLLNLAEGSTRFESIAKHGEQLRNTEIVCGLDARKHKWTLSSTAR